MRLVSESPCLAVVRAFVTADLVESRPAYVNFEAPMTMFVDRRASHFDGDFGDSTWSVSWLERHCVTCAAYRNGELYPMSESPGRILTTIHWPGFVQPGDVIRFVWTPIDGCAHLESNPPYDMAYISEAYIHYF